jgi:MinD superfamily P-loop ATPase
LLGCSEKGLDDAHNISSVKNGVCDACKECWRFCCRITFSMSSF